MSINLAEILAGLGARHRAALQWFVDHAGTRQEWPDALEDGTLLGTRAKGIYKPKWSDYALSVRQSLDSPYGDCDPEVRPDGTWTYAYHQEIIRGTVREDLFTNRGLLACMRDGIPVGVLRQVTDRPKPTYQVLNVALVAGWDGGFFFLEGFSVGGVARGRGPQAEVDNYLAFLERGANRAGAFDPNEVIDGRERIIGSIIQRRGQPAFRRALLDLYGERCALTDCDVVEVLEAGHIVPYMGPTTNHPSNGILLRSDLHTLFDLGLIAIDAATLSLKISASLLATPYGSLAGRPVRVPSDPSARPNVAALEHHRAWSGL